MELSFLLFQFNILLFLLTTSSLCSVSLSSSFFYLVSSAFQLFFNVSLFFRAGSEILLVLTHAVMALGNISDIKT